jgi:hypothetical protein
MASEKKQPYLAKVALTMSFPEERYFKDGVGLKVLAKGNGSSVPVAISRAVRLAFKHPSVKRKSPAYINFTVTVRSRWILDEDMPTKLQ